MPRTRLLVLALLAALLTLAPVASGTSPGLVVSQVYAGGGNSGATYQNDFVELLNRGSSAIDLSGWTVQYASAASTSWSVTTLAGTVQPGHYYLVALNSAGSIGAALPAADATGTTNLAVSGGKMAIVHDTSPLTCGATVGSCSATSAVTDLLGYGNATDYEGDAAPALSATLAAVRAGGGCTDTDVNSTDFTAVAPAPHNGSSTAASCGVTSGATQQAAVALDVQSVLSMSLDHASLSYGTVAAGDTPSALADHLTVMSNSLTGYALTVHRSVFAPEDLPLAIATTAPTGGSVGSLLAGGVLARIPVPPTADLLVGTTATRSAASGDIWPASVGFATALPAVTPGHYTATITFTVVAR